MTGFKFIYEVREEREFRHCLELVCPSPNDIDMVINNIATRSRIYAEIYQILSEKYRDPFAYWMKDTSFSIHYFSFKDDALLIKMMVDLAKY